MTDSQAKIQKAEREFDIHIVEARGTGSHAWGYADGQSDTDVTAIFVHGNPAEYRKIGETMVSFSQPFKGDEVEISGWDVGKFADMLVQSNPTAIEFLFSDIRFRSTLPEGFMQEFTEYITGNYNPCQLYHSYRSFAKNNYRDYLSRHLSDGENGRFQIVDETEDVWIVRERANNADLGESMEISKDNEMYEETQFRPTVKRNLIILSALLRARFIIDYYDVHGEHEFPSPHLPTFLEEQAPVAATEEERELLDELIQMKKRGEGNKQIGDKIGYENAHLPKDIAHHKYSRSGPEAEVLDEFIETCFTSAGF